jgi:1-pyrroline-5-carboxylate dehydrogenase
MKLPRFKNEPFTDFSKPENRKKMEKALLKVESELGREYDIVIGGERIRTQEKFYSYNPSKKDQVVGVLQKGDAELAKRGD